MHHQILARTTDNAPSFSPDLPEPVHVSASGQRQAVFVVLDVDGVGEEVTEGGDRPVNTACPDNVKAGTADVHTELNNLMLNVRSGCRRSFDLFYDMTRVRLLRAVQNIIRNRDDAADVLQDVYTKVWGRSAQFQHDKGNALNWALAIAHHTAVSSLRMRSARPQTCSTGLGMGADGDEADPYAGLESPWLSPDELAIQQQACRAVRSAMHRLPNDHREALLLAFYEGLSYDEVATRMSRPLGTIKSWIRRSLAALQPVVDVHRDVQPTAQPAMQTAVPGQQVGYGRQHQKLPSKAPSRLRQPGRSSAQRRMPVPQAMGAMV